MAKKTKAIEVAEFRDIVGGYLRDGKDSSGKLTTKEKALLDKTRGVKTVSGLGDIIFNYFKK
jgi:hypothetical protein